MKAVQSLLQLDEGERLGVGFTSWESHVSLLALCSPWMTKHQQLQGCPWGIWPFHPWESVVLREEWHNGPLFLAGLSWANGGIVKALGWARVLWRSTCPFSYLQEGQLIINVVGQRYNEEKVSVTLMSDVGCTGREILVCLVNNLVLHVPSSSSCLCFHQGVPVSACVF